MASSKPASAGLPATSGRVWLWYTPANAARLSALPGAIAAARPAMFTCARSRTHIDTTVLWMSYNKAAGVHVLLLLPSSECTERGA